MNETRRRLLASGAAAGISTLGSGLLARSAAPATADREPGIQLWSVRREIEQDPTATLTAIASFGYRIVETAGFGGLSAAEFRKRLDDNGLQCVSAHQSFDIERLSAVFDDANALGAHYTTSGFLRRGTGVLPASGPNAGFMGTLHNMSTEDAKITAELCNRIGEGAKRSGLKYCYHNHFFELGNLGGGRTGFDILLEATDPDLVVFEIDCGWMVVAGRDPVVYLREMGTRFPMLHIKDFLPIEPGQLSPGERRSTELGAGEIDYAPILAAARDANVEYYLVEQEDPFTRLPPLEAAEANYRTLAQLLSA